MNAWRAKAINSLQMRKNNNKNVSFDIQAANCARLTQASARAVLNLSFGSSIDYPNLLHCNQSLFSWHWTRPYQILSSKPHNLARINWAASIAFNSRWLEFEADKVWSMEGSAHVGCDQNKQCNQNAIDGCKRTSARERVDWQSM